MLNRREMLRLVPASALAAVGVRIAGAQEADYGRIDSHIHVHREAPELAEALKATGWRGLDIVVCPAVGDEEFDLDVKIAATRAVAQSSGGAIAWASTFDARGFEEPDFVERTIAHLKQTFDDGAIGVKIWKTIGMAIRGASGAYLLPDNPRLLPIYEAIRDADRTLVAHIAEPDGAWLPLDEDNPEFPYYSRNPQWYMGNKQGAPSKEEILAARDRVLGRFPDLRVIGCHLGSNEDDLTKLARRLDDHPNFLVDTAARIRYLAAGDHELVRDFLLKYQDRIIYGTDYGFRGGDPNAAAQRMNAIHEQDIAFFNGDAPMEYNGKPTRGLTLPEPVLRKIFRENALRWLPGMTS